MTAALPLQAVRPSLGLRPYQLAAHAALREGWRRGGACQMVVLPTGCGKTITALAVVAGALERGRRVLWLGHREELIEQPTRTLSALWHAHAKEIGVVKAAKDDWYARAVFASIDTLARGPRLEKVLAAGPVDLVIVDECHHSASASWSRVLDGVAAHGTAQGRPAFFLGLTATPERADGKPLGARWEVAFSYPITQAIQEGFLAPPRFVVDQLEVDLSHVGSHGGDYDAAELGEALLAAHVVDHTCASMQAHARGIRSVVFTATVRQAEETAASLEAAGWRARAVSGETPTADRRSILKALSEGRLDVVCNAAVLTEGWDDPSVGCVVLARPTRSKGLYCQMVGRGLRLHPGKSECLVLDLAAASQEFELLQAPALLEHGKDGEGRKGRKGAAREGGRSLYAGMGAERVRAEFSWVRVPGLDRQAWALGAGQEGTVVALEGADGWRSLLIRRKGRSEALAHGEVSLDLALGLGADFARQAQAAGLTRRGAAWRQQPASEKQIELGKRLGITVGCSAGEAEQAITAELASRDLARRRLASRVQERGTQLEAEW